MAHHRTAETLFAITTLLRLSVAVYAAANLTEVNPRWKPLYHLAPPRGWMNDPNGFSYFRGEYHLFYQHNPYSSLVPGIAEWGHAKSTDLFHWEDLPIAMSPNRTYDKDGVFSGSAIVVNDTLVLMYTGHINRPGETPDHEEHQAIAFSEDGVNVVKYPWNPVISADQLQPDFRDPKVWEHDGIYYAVLGNRYREADREDRGRALLFASEDLINWAQVSVLDESDGDLGYMWECPDFFELEGKHVLLVSPQGIDPQGDRFRNLYQTGYILGDFDYETLQFNRTSEFVELDAGHDLYATQTILSEDGRRIVIAWMDMWEQVYPERDDGWTGQMTVARTLHLVDGKIIQKPVTEIESLRRGALYSARAVSGEEVALRHGATEIIVNATGDRIGLRLEWGGNTSLTLTYANRTVELVRGSGEEDVRRAPWSPAGQPVWRVLVDRSSVELFCGEGELTFTSRFFPTGPVRLQVTPDSAPLHLHVEALGRSVGACLWAGWWTLLPSLLIHFIVHYQLTQHTRS